MSTFVDEAPAPYAELRTTLALASLSVALIGVMSAVHGLAPAPFAVAMAAVEALVAFGLAATRARWVLGPAVAVHVPVALVWVATRASGAQPVDLGGVVGVLAGLVVAGGALALARDAGDRACRRWSRLAFVVFAGAALTGFGHVGH